MFNLGALASIQALEADPAPQLYDDVIQIPQENTTEYTMADQPVLKIGTHCRPEPKKYVIIPIIEVNLLCTSIEIHVSSSQII